MWKEIKKILKKWIFALTPLRIWSIFSYLVCRMSAGEIQPKIPQITRIIFSQLGASDLTFLDASICESFVHIRRGIL